jgi:hypothetical protein
VTSESQDPEDPENPDDPLDTEQPEDPNDPEDPENPTDPEDVDDIDESLIVITDENEEYQLDTSKIGNDEFSVQVPETGYLKIKLKADEFIYDDSVEPPAKPEVSITTDGLDGHLDLHDSSYQCIGVHEGLYNFGIKTESENYTIVVRFCKTAESKYSKTKSSAPAIKSGLTYKGLFYAGTESTNNQIHWDKLKNTKSQKVFLYLYPQLLSGGASNSAIKVSVYNGKKHADFSFKPGITGKKIRLYNSGDKKKKLAKGTYYVKVQAIGDCNGLFKLKWDIE